MEQNMIPMVTPMEINEKIEEFCETISTEKNPIYIDVSPHDECEKILFLKDETSSEEGFYLSQEMINRYSYFMKKFSEPRGKNEVCSCESNIKYKSCCGKTTC